MKIIIRETAEEAAQTAAAEILDAVRGKPDLTLGLATGGTMLPLYDHLAQAAGDAFRAVTTFNLDEYIGLPPEHPASYHTYMNDALFARLSVLPRAIHIPRGDAADPAEEARRYDAAIADAGGIDLQLLGLGRNGHIGFNEPGSPRASRTRLVRLTENTRMANARFFAAPEDVPWEAISMGVGTILEARRSVLLATGDAKADATWCLLHGPVGPEFPASFLRDQSDLLVILDAAAASKLRADVAS